jgi:hypothetical protein
MDERTQEKIARNDATFREANERIAASADEYRLPDRVPFLCECADTSCTEIVRLSLDEYEAVRSDPTHFFNAPGHDAAAGAAAMVIERHDGYVVVEKLGRAADVADQLDPRQQAL